MQSEKDSQSVSLAASDLSWSDVREDAKKSGHNTVSSYIQKLVEWNHKEIKRRPYYKGLLKLAIVLCIILIAILLMVRF
jgi:hypothetical protein